MTEFKFSVRHTPGSIVQCNSGSAFEYEQLSSSVGRR
jgi:hypothetical protein